MTNHRRFIAAALALTLALLAGPAVAQEAKKSAPTDTQDQISILLDTIRTNRRALVAVNLNLGADEAKNFWPIYDKYLAELATNQDKVVAVVDEYSKNFSTLADDKAVKLIQDYLAAESERVQLRQSYLPQFQKVIPGRTLARLYQLENKMDAVIRYAAAEAIPVIDEKAEAKPAGK
jgi:hypothetical protein